MPIPNNTPVPDSVRAGEPIRASLLNRIIRLCNLNRISGVTGGGVVVSQDEGKGSVVNAGNLNQYAAVMAFGSPNSDDEYDLFVSPLLGFANDLNATYTQNQLSFRLAKVMLVALEQTGGAAGGIDSNCSFTYNVYRGSHLLASDYDCTTSRMDNTAYNPATVGIAFVNTSGAIEDVIAVNETAVTQTIEIVTNVSWDGVSSLKQYKKMVTVLAADDEAAENTVLTAVDC